MVTNSHCLFRCNNTIEEDNNTLPSSSSSLQHQHRKKRSHIAIIFFLSNTKKTKHTRKQQKKPREKEGTYLQTLTLPSHFWLPFLPICFKCFLLTSSSFQLQEEKKEKKNHKEEKKCRKGKELSFNLLLCFLIFGSCFYLHTFGLLFQTLFLGIFFFLRKKKKKKKKT